VEEFLKRLKRLREAVAHMALHVGHELITPLEKIPNPLGREPARRQADTDAQPLDGGGIETLFDAALGHDQQRLLQIQRLADELVPSRAHDGPAGGQVFQKG
jgi:hypothetical protein